MTDLTRERFGYEDNLSVRFGLCLASVAIAVLLYREPITDIIVVAIRNPDQAYVFLVPLLVVYLAWLRRSRYRIDEFKPSVVGVMLVAASLILYVVGIKFDILVFWHMAFLVALLGIVVTLFGRRIIGDFLPAILVFFAVIPIPGSMKSRRWIRAIS